MNILAQSGATVIGRLPQFVGSDGNPGQVTGLAAALFSLDGSTQVAAVSIGSYNSALDCYPFSFTAPTVGPPVSEMAQYEIMVTAGATAVGGLSVVGTEGPQITVTVSGLNECDLQLWMNETPYSLFGGAVNVFSQADFAGIAGAPYGLVVSGDSSYADLYLPFGTDNSGVSAYFQSATNPDNFIESNDLDEGNWILNVGDLQYVGPANDESAAGSYTLLGHPTATATILVPATGTIVTTLAAILSRISVTPIQAIVLVQPGGAITLEQYCSYRAERGNPLPIPNPGGWPDLTGADVHLWIAAQQSGVPIMPPVIDISSGTVQGTDSAPTGVDFDISSTNTAKLTNFAQRAYSYCLVAYYASNGDQVPLTDWADCTARPGVALAS